MQPDGADDRDAIRRAVLELAAAGRAFYARGWLLATSGNLSARLGPAAALVTASGTDKGDLGEGDFLVIDHDGAPLGGATSRPSAEAVLHGALYRRFAGAGAVLHVHAPAATAISLAAEGGQEGHDGGTMGGDRPTSPVVTLAGYEMLKALHGVTTHDHVERVPVVANDQDTARLAVRANEALDRAPGAHAYLIAGHGLYTWGRSVAEARRQVEALEFLFECELRRAMLRGGMR